MCFGVTGLMFGDGYIIKKSQDCPSYSTMVFRKGEDTLLIVSFLDQLTPAVTVTRYISEVPEVT